MKNTLYILISFIALVFQSCENGFEEINKNPNAALVSEADPSLILANILYETGNHITASLGWGTGNIVMQLTATNNFTGTDIYNWGTYSGSWNLYYRNIRDAQNLISIGEEKSNDNLRAIGLILKSWMFTQLTEMYGDVPYSEAIQGKEGNFTPVYDDQKNIYAGILDDYSTANTLLNSIDIVNGDIMFSGDYMKWKKFCNSLRIRTLMRLENKWTEMGLSASNIQSIVDNEPIMSSNQDNALISYLESNPNQWPLFTSRIGSFEEKRMSVKIENVLKAIDDPRLPILFRPVANPDTPGEYIGIPNGLSEDNAISYNGGPKNQSTLGTRFREDPNAVDMTFMRYSELQFILAEAAEKGYISGGSLSAEESYLNGINADFDYYGITPAPEYFDLDGVNYSLNTNETKLELIGKQKWLSFFLVGLEGWFDWRRTGIPSIQPGPDALHNTVPVRIQYPGDEQVLNSNNLSIAVSKLGNDEITSPFWLLK